MSNRKNHHFVPQFYFRRFSQDEKSICVLTKATGQLIEKASIKSQASRNNFYGSDELESALGEIEGACSATLRNLVALENPTLLEGSDVSKLLLHIALQRSRTMSARTNGQAFQDKIARLFTEMALNLSTEIDENTRKLLLENLEDIGAEPVQAHRIQMGVAVEAAGALEDLLPIMLVNKTNRPFVFSDAPVVFYNALYRNVRHRGVLGLSTPGLLVVFPLSSSQCLMLVDSARYKILRAKNNCISIREFRDVAAINKLQLHAASSCVYFADFQYARYVSELWRQEQCRFRPHTGVVVEAPGFDAGTGEPMGDIVHGFEPQLPYPFSLSFLQHPVLGDEDYQFSRRSDMY